MSDRSAGGTLQERRMHRNKENGSNPHHRPREDSRFEDLVGKLLHCKRNQKRKALYMLFCDLFGEDPGAEVPLTDPQGGVYGYFLPPAAHARIELLEKPDLKAELDRRSRSPGLPISASEYISSHRSRKK
jgi:hypothetical protein